MSNEIKDLSGASTPNSQNPFDALIIEANHDPQSIQNFYSSHRTNRNVQQSQKLLSPEFRGMTLDPIFLKTIDLANEGKDADDRHCLVFWARPPAAVRELVSLIQGKLKAHAPNTWLMPLDRLHMNVFEITHSRTEAEIDALEAQLAPRAREIVDWTFDHRPRLIKPLLGYDSSAVALTFVPAAGDSLHVGVRDVGDGDTFTYHHLRRDIYSLCTSTGVPITSRYTVPSAHLTVARFVTQQDFVGRDGSIDTKKVRMWVEALDGINEWLMTEYWPEEEDWNAQIGIKRGGEWIVGQENGLDHRRGTLWYGGGETVMLGRGF